MIKYKENYMSDKCLYSGNEEGNVFGLINAIQKIHDKFGNYVTSKEEGGSTK